MALTANIEFASVSADGTYSYITDSTTYGGANPDRNEVGIFLSAYKVSSALVESALVLDSFDPATVTQFRVTNTVDGRYKFYFIIADTWLIGTTYNQYDVVWSPTEEGFFEYTNSTPTAGNLVTNTTYFTPLPDPTTKIADVGTDEESENLIYQVIEKIIDYDTAKCYATAMTQFASESCGSTDCGCSSKLGKSVEKLRVLLTVMRINDTRQQYSSGELNARSAEKYCTDCGCLNE